MKSGVLRVSTDPAYPPQSSLDEKTGKWEGFDIDVATEIAKRLGVKVEWKTPAWDTITAGHWNGRWDVSVGSMTVTPERAQVLYFTPAYYYTPAGLAVYKTNTTFTDPSQLSGKKIGVCGDCTYEKYLEQTLQIPGYKIDFKISNPDIHTYDTDTTAIEDLSLGDGVRLDAVMSAVPTLEQAIKDGKPIKMLGQPLFFEPLAVAIDRSSTLDPTSLVKKIGDIITAMHNDGTLTRLSMKWYGTDLTMANG
jgi:polar amino acid transport system substrate-binding protein